MPKLLIIDGHNLLFQMFFGMPSKIIGKDGKTVHGILGFIAALLKITRQIAPTHLLVVFDGVENNPRKSLDSEYKANRPDYSLVPDDETPLTQLDGIFKALEHLGVLYVETSDCEADDVITAYAESFPGDVVISSYDSDFFQLISERVRVFRYKGDYSTLCDSDFVFRRCGVGPELYAEHKCLVGDTADNIRGVMGVGPKTAASLLLRFGSLDNLILHCDEIEKEKIRTAIEESKDRLLLNRELIKLSPTACTEILPDKLEIPAFPTGGAGSILREVGIL